MTKRKVKKYLPFIIVIAVLTVIFLFVKSQNGSIKINANKAEVRELQRTVSASGSTDVTDGFTVRALVAGTVKEVKFKSGEAVKAGDLIIEMDRASLKASMDSAYTAYLSAKSDFDSYDQRIKAAEATESIRKRERDEVWREYMANNGEDNKQAFKNAESLYQAALSSLNVLQEDKSSVKNAVFSAYSGYVSTLNNYKNSSIISPSDGFLALSDIYNGSYVLAGQELFSITNPNNLVFKAEIDEADVSLVKVGTKATLTLDSYPGKSYEGTVQNVDAKVIILTNGSTAVMAEVTFNTNEVQPMTGLNGSVDIEVAKSSAIISITPDSIVEEGDKKYVYVVSGGKVSKRIVETGFEGDEYTGVVSGLNEGDMVVADPGSLKLTDGQKIKL